MVEELIDISDTDLNAEGIPNKSICPLCHNILENAEAGYEYSRFNADTRWFWCDTCKGHLGYYRMHKTWKVDPHDLDQSEELRKHFGLDPATEIE